MRSPTTPVLARRSAERERLIELARAYALEVARSLPLRGAVVYGSVARGDFNLWSDVDLLLLSDALPGAWRERQNALPPRPGAVQPIAWTSAEWRRQLARGNPISLEATTQGVWLIGSPADL